MTKLFKISIFACLSFFITSGSTTAETVEKINLEADHVKMNIDTGYSEYTGKVKVTQGDLVLTGDKVTVQQGSEEVERITVTGKPAHYNHVTDKGESIQAESEHMVYTASKNKLVLTVNAKLEQPDHKLSSQKITYDTLKKIVIAGDKSEPSTGKSTGTNKSQRVNITLTPKK